MNPLALAWDLMLIKERKRLLKETGESTVWSYRVYKFIPRRIREDMEYCFRVRFLNDVKLLMGK